jgi:hypothetical protein
MNSELTEQERDLIVNTLERLALTKAEHDLLSRLRYERDGNERLASTRIPHPMTGAL